MWAQSRRSASILLVDDDVELCAVIRDYFAAHGYTIETVQNGCDALSKAFEQQYDLIILDVMMPVLDGFEVLRQLRRKSAVPVIMLTARTEHEDRIAGLEAGADDYVPKPFALAELLARVRAVLRRTGSAPGQRADVILVGELRIHPETREVWNGTKPVQVTSLEFELLELLARSAGKVVSRDQIAAVIYHRKATPYERSIDVHMSHLRKKLGLKRRPMIKTIRGAGYMMVSEDPDTSSAIA
jgi:two-component system, OmpR family, response regulator CpxR